MITTSHETPQFERLLGNGSSFGISITYARQALPDGIARAFILGADHIGHDTAALVLGDDILYGSGVGTDLQVRERRGRHDPRQERLRRYLLGLLNE